MSAIKECNNKVTVGYSSFLDEPIQVTCGSWYAGTQVICEKCEQRLIKHYPQGWRYTPGDVCKHGVYVGGCGADYMCGRCENGE